MNCCMKADSISRRRRWEGFSARASAAWSSCASCSASSTSERPAFSNSACHAHPPGSLVNTRARDGDAGRGGQQGNKARATGQLGGPALSSPRATRSKKHNGPTLSATGLLSVRLRPT
eukprot:4921695-Pyramimonas_sp.AAC.1